MHSPEDVEDGAGCQASENRPPKPQDLKEGTVHGDQDPAQAHL